VILDCNFLIGLQSATDRQTYARAMSTVCCRA